jgi:hypothetical protein
MTTTPQDSTFWTSRIAELDRQIISAEADIAANVARRAGEVAAGGADGAGKDAARSIGLETRLAELKAGREEAKRLHKAAAADEKSARLRADAAALADLIRARIQAGKDFDAAAQTLERIFERYTQLGFDIADAIPHVRGGTLVSHFEGMTRPYPVIAALPPFAKTLMHQNPSPVPQASLAEHAASYLQNDLDVCAAILSAGHVAAS